MGRADGARQDTIEMVKHKAVVQGVTHEQNNWLLVALIAHPDSISVCAWMALGRLFL